MREECGIDGVFLYRLKRLPDERGSFCELFRREWFQQVFDGEEVQVNCSVSHSGVVRGLHYHRLQTDFWIPLSGEIVAGLADIREDSPTYGKSLSLPMSAESPAGLLIPPGIAHGFSARTDLMMMYVVNRYFDDTDEYGIAWDDPAFGIQWGVKEPILSERDSSNPRWTVVRD